MRDSFLPFSPPCIGEEEIAEVVDTLRSGWLTTGPKVKQFEQEFAAFVGAPASLALTLVLRRCILRWSASGLGRATPSSPPR